MGIKRIDFGNVEVSRGSKVKALRPSNHKDNSQDVVKRGYLAEVAEVKYNVAGTGNIGIKVTWKVTEEDAVDIDGTSYVGRKVWDNLWFGEKSLKMTKLKLAGLLGDAEVDNLVIENEADVQDLAERLQEEVLGVEFAIVTDTEESTYNNGVYDDGTQRYDTRLAFVNPVS